MRRTVVVVLCLAAVTLAVCAGCMHHKGPRDAALKPQVTCPVMGAKIDKELYVDAAGYRIYVCCRDCLDKVKADPKKYIQKIRDNGEVPEVRPVVCPKCGEMMGSDKCCAAGAEKCPKCGLHKGSIGCCRNLKPMPGEKEIVLCPKCGEMAGSDKCCASSAARCPKCGMIAHSPGCCKMP